MEGQSHIAMITAPYLFARAWSSASSRLSHGKATDPALLALLQRALGAAGEADIRWSSR